MLALLQAMVPNEGDAWAWTIDSLVQFMRRSSAIASSQAQLRRYLLHVKLKKHWKSNTLRQCVACARIFYVELLQHANWSVFSEIRTKDHSFLPAVLSRSQVVDLIAHIRLRRYRTPIKLIYCCGLRLGECLALTIHDIPRGDTKLLVPGAGLDAHGRVIQVRNPKFLVHLPLLQAAFRQEFRERLNALGRAAEPAVWRKQWGVHIQACGKGGSAVKYLGAYVRARLSATGAWCRLLPPMSPFAGKIGATALLYRS